jgi:hypothetical protein
MSMPIWNGDIQQALKWLQSNAPRIQSIIQAKAKWYDLNNKAFWDAWQTNVFNLKTANTFGLMVWCVILGVPSQLFGLQGTSNAWAYGKNRQNFKWDPSLSPGLQNPNTIGGNFYGGGRTTLTSLTEVRYALLLRYAALVSNGRIEFVNRMLKNIFSPDAAYDYTAKKFAVVRDVTHVSGAQGPFQIEYLFGSGLNLSAQFTNLLQETEYGILPQFAGSKITVTLVP